MAAEALGEGREATASGEPEVTGPLSALRLLKDPEVSKGLDFLVKVCRALASRL